MGQCDTNATLPFVLGLTGSIGMGKSTVSTMFSGQGVPVFDSDAVVHQLYAPGGAAVAGIEECFPGVVVDGGVDRKLLSQQVMDPSRPGAMKLLESIVHPLVAQARRDFVSAQRGAPLILLDIPLLYETGGERFCDAVVVVSAPESIQRARVLARDGMTAEKLDGILTRQLKDEEKRRRADFILDTSLTIEETEEHVIGLLKALKGRVGAAAAKILKN